ncbi:UNVERIFIED_CONTAM: hypothetical protein FKN15_073775 [Acipenser sinensis]
MDKVDAYMKLWHEHQRELKEGGATWCLAYLEYGHLPDVCPYEDPLFVQAFDRGEVETAEVWIRLKAIPSPQVDQETCLTCLKGGEWCFAVGKVEHKAPNQPPPWQEEEGRLKGSWEAYLSALEAVNWCTACGEWGHFVANCPILQEEEEEKHQSPASEGELHQSPASKGEPQQFPAIEGEPHQSPATGGDYTLLPPSSPGDYTLLDPPEGHTITAAPNQPPPWQEEEGRLKGSWEAYLSALEAVNWCTACGEWGHFVANCPILQEEEEEKHQSPASEGELHQSPASKGEPQQFPAIEGEPHQSPATGGDYTLLPPSSPGDYTLLPPPPLPPAGAEQQELPLPHPLPGAEQQELPLPSPPPPPEAEQQELPLPLPPPSPGAEQQELPPPPPAEGEYLLVLPPLPWVDYLPLPPPPAEDDNLLVPPPPPSEDYLPLPPPPQREDCLPLPPAPPWEGLLLPCLTLPKDACLAPPKDACLAPPKDACLAPPKDACHASPGVACCSSLPGVACCPTSPGVAEDPASPGAAAVSASPEVTAVSASPEVAAGSASPGVVAGSASLGVVVGSASPAVVAGSASPGKLPAMKMGGEVRRPPSPTALSLQEIRWPEPQKMELPATESRGEGQETTPTGRWEAARLLWPEEPTCVREYNTFSTCTEQNSEIIGCFWPNPFVESFIISLHKHFFSNCTSDQVIWEDPPDNMLTILIVIPVLLTVVMIALVVWCSKRNDILV